MFLRIVLVSFLLVGIALTLFGIWFIALGNDAGRWPQTQGTVVSVMVRTDSHHAGSPAITEEQRERRRRYFPSISYRWEVDGKTYHGSRYRLGTTAEKHKQREQAQAAAANYRIGASIPVFYDPENPAEAVLDKRASGAVWVPLPLGLLVTLMGWACLRHIGAVRKALAAGDAEPLDLP